MNRILRLSPLLSVCLVAACSSDPGEEAPSGPPVAHDAAEAWPTQPTGVPVVSPERVLAACAVAGQCSEEVASSPLETRLTLVDLCLFDAMFSLERAIPLSGFARSNERVEWWVQCVEENAAQCADVTACRTDRAPHIHCEEAGCSSGSPFEVTCNGTTATLTLDGTWERDCARAFAECDPKSPTGCTDRHRSHCPAYDDKQDRCDGDIRLGCDSANLVSYRDCTRMGGTCESLDDGGQGCSYPQAPDPECAADDVTPATCEGKTLRACVNGRRLAIESSLCDA